MLIFSSAAANLSSASALPAISRSFICTKPAIFSRARRSMRSVSTSSSTRIEHWCWYISSGVGQPSQSSVSMSTFIAGISIAVCTYSNRGLNAPRFEPTSCRRKWGAGNWRATSGWGSDVLQTVCRMVCTWRAPSSPHLACGLNGSFFLRPCGPLNTAPAGGLLRVVGWSKTCGTLHRGGISLKASGGSAVEGEGGVSKRVISVISPQKRSGGHVFRGG